VGGLAYRHQQGRPQGLFGAGRQVDHEGGQAVADPVARALGIHGDDQGQDDSGPQVGQPGRQRHLAGLEQGGGAGGDLGQRRSELVEGRGGCHRGRVGDHRGQGRAGVHRPPKLRRDVQAPDGRLAPVADRDPVAERGGRRGHR
jgi:hypothetical protein